MLRIAVIFVTTALLASCADQDLASTFNRNRTNSARYGAPIATSVSNREYRPRFLSNHRLPHRRVAHRAGGRPDNFFTWVFDNDNRNSIFSTRKKKAANKRPSVSPTRVHQMVLSQSTKGNTNVVIDVGRQKVFLLVNDRVAVEAPVSTARPGKHTPRGTFRVTERVRTGKVSTIYGVGMPFWMRLSGSVYGVHAGYLPGYPASAGCVRLPSDAAQLIYDHTKHGTRVSIYSTWAG